MVDNVEWFLIFTLIVIFVPDSNRNMRLEYMYVYSLLLLEYIKRLDYLQIMNCYFLFTMSEESQVGGS